MMPIANSKYRTCYVCWSLIAASHAIGVDDSVIGPVHVCEKCYDKYYNGQKIID